MANGLLTGGAINYGISYSPRVNISNVRLVYDGTKLGLVQANGSVFTPKSPGYIYVDYGDPSISSRGVVTYKLQSDIYYINAAYGNSDMASSLFGTTTLLKWEHAMPFWLYIADNGSDDVPMIFLCRIPSRIKTPNNNNSIGYPGLATVTSSEESIFFMTRTASSYTRTSLKCLPFGTALFNKNTSDNWKCVSSDPVLAVSSGGLLNLMYGSYFNMPFEGHYSASTSVYTPFKANGGTAPDVSTDQIRYSFLNPLLLQIKINLTHDTSGTAGAGAVNLICTVPLTSSATTVRGFGNFTNNAYGTGPVTILSSGGNAVIFGRHTVSGANVINSTKILNSDVDNTVTNTLEAEIFARWNYRDT